MLARPGSTSRSRLGPNERALAHVDGGGAARLFAGGRAPGELAVRSAMAPAVAHSGGNRRGGDLGGVADDDPQPRLVNRSRSGGGGRRGTDPRSDESGRDRSRPNRVIRRRV